MSEAPTTEQRPVGVPQALLLTSGAAVLTMVFLFLETIVAARLVSTGEYGVYVLIVAVVNFVMMAVDLGSKTAVVQLIARADGPRRAALVNTAVLFRLAVIGIVALLIWLPHDLFALFEPVQDMVPYVTQLPAMILVASLDQLLFGMLQGFQAYRALAATQILRSVLRLLLTALMLGPMGLGVSGLLYSWTLSFGASAVYQYRALPATKGLHIDRAVLRELLRFGAPLQLAGFLWFVFSRIQTFVLGVFGGPTAVAQFAVASRIPEALQQVAESYIAVYFPKMTAMLAAGRHAPASRVLETSLRLVSYGAAVLALACVLFSAEITELIFSARYAASAPAFAILMIALHMVLVVNMMGYTLTSAGHPQRSLIVDIIRTTVVLGSSLALVPGFGFIGAAYARLLSSYCGTPAVVWLLSRDGPTTRIGSWLKPTAILLICAALAWWTQPAGVLARVGVGIVFVILSVRLGAITQADLRLLIPLRPVPPAVHGAPDSA